MKSYEDSGGSGLRTVAREGSRWVPTYSTPVSGSIAAPAQLAPPALGTVYRETEVERADLETIITDLMPGQFNDPIRVVAFNTLEHWSEDVSEYIAFEIQTRCGIQGAGVPEHIRDFVASYAGPTRQLALRLV